MHHLISVRDACAHIRIVLQKSSSDPLCSVVILTPAVSAAVRTSIQPDVQQETQVPECTGPDTHAPLLTTGRSK